MAPPCNTNINLSHRRCLKCSRKMWALKCRKDGLLYGHNFVACKNTSQAPFFYAWLLGVEHSSSTTTPFTRTCGEPISHYAALPAIFIVFLQCNFWSLTHFSSSSNNLLPAYKLASTSSVYFRTGT
ncbi:hypothetical protein K438DRAFT_1978880 [Mycena galopus ATCC 62051]|nr:hypothetical protein K438DRAFT_1978880 [Mycena galopus ATCC 62051]